MKRDTELDFFRGFSIVWVLFIHCIYWVGFLTSDNATIFKSYLLMEMPLLFLITGATNSLSNRQIRYSDYLLKRIPRIVIPYWVYAVICVFITQMTVTYLNFEGKVNYTSWFLTFGYKGDWWSNIPYVTSHLWFIPVYLVILLFIPLLKKIFNNLQGQMKLIPLIVIIILIAFLDYFNFSKGNLFDSYFYMKNILFFGFWIYLGLFYCTYKERDIKKLNFLGVAFVSYTITFLLIKFGYDSNMQYNKFPPNLAFLFLNVGNISLILFMKDYIIKVAESLSINGFIENLGEYSYTVYLYQPFAFLFGGMILSLLNIALYDHDIIGITYYLTINIIGAFIFIKVFGKVESLNITSLVNVLRRK